MSIKSKIVRGAKNVKAGLKVISKGNLKTIGSNLKSGYNVAINRAGKSQYIREVSNIVTPPTKFVTSNVGSGLKQITSGNVKQSSSDLIYGVKKVPGVNSVLSTGSRGIKSIGRSSPRQTIKNVGAGVTAIKQSAPTQFVKQNTTSGLKQITSGTPRQTIKQFKAGYVRAVNSGVPFGSTVRNVGTGMTTLRRGSLTEIKSSAREGVRQATSPKAYARYTVAGATALAPAVISRFPNLTRGAYYRVTGEYIPQEKVFSRKALKGSGLTTGYTAKRTYKEFKATKGAMKERPDLYVGVHSTAMPSKIKVVKGGSRGIQGKEDLALYVHPKGQGATRFLETSGENYKISLIPSINIKNPSVYEIGVSKIKRFPKSVIKSKGFESVKKYQESRVGESAIYVTKRHTLGQTSEGEGGIGIGKKIVSIKTKKPLYTIVNKQVVPIYRTEVIPTSKLKVKIKSGGKIVPISKIKKASKDLYYYNYKSSGKKILVPLNSLISRSKGKSVRYYDISKQSIGTSKSNASSKLYSKYVPKESYVGKSPSKTSRGSSDVTSKGSSKGRSSGSSSRGSSGRSRGGSSTTRRPPTKNPPTTTMMLNRFKPSMKNKQMIERSYVPMIKKRGKFIKINTNKRYNYNAALNFAARKVDDYKDRQFRLMPTNQPATIFNKTRSGVLNKFTRTKTGIFTEKKRFIRDRPFEKRRR
jgi:hypothetical protein